MAGRHVGYPEPVQKQTCWCSVYPAKSQTSAKSTNHIHQRAVNPKAVLPVCFYSPVRFSQVLLSQIYLLLCHLQPVWVRPSGTSQNASSGRLIPWRRLSSITSNNCWTNSRFMWVANYLECLMRETCSPHKHIYACIKHFLTKRIAHPKPVWMSFFFWTQKEMWIDQTDSGSTDFHSWGRLYYGRQCGPETVLSSKYLLLCPAEERKFWNNMRATRWFNEFSF